MTDNLLEIKRFGLVSRIRDVVAMAFWVVEFSRQGCKIRMNDSKYIESKF